MNKNIASGIILLVVSSLVSHAQAAPISCLAAGDPTVVQGASVATFQSLGVNPATTCISNTLWSDPASFTLGTYLKGANGMGGTPDPNVLNWNGATVDGTFAGNANQRDLFWVQDTGNGTIFGNNVSGGRPSQGIIWDLGGQANQAAVFVQVDHGPLPGEVLENTVWLSNDPNSPDNGWTQALLDTVYLQGWLPNPAIADGFTPVYRLPNEQTFQYVSVTWGGPGAVLQDGDNEIDAVGGLTFTGGGLPNPGTLLLLSIGLIAAGWRRLAMT